MTFPVRLPVFPEWIKVPLSAFLLSRVVVLLAGYLGQVLIHADPKPGQWHVAPGNLILDPLARFDSGFYLSIITQGYSLNPGEQSNVAFFPLYPLLVNLLQPLFGPGDFGALVAGTVVSHLCFLWALVFLYRLTLLEFGDNQTAARAVVYLCAFPTSFFFSMVYTESTFLLCATATMFYARQRQWGWATVFAFLTTSSRIVGILTYLMVMLEFFRGCPIQPRRLWERVRQDTLSAVLIHLAPLSLLFHMIFLSFSVSDPLAFWTVQSAWGRENLGPIGSFIKDWKPLVSQNWLTGLNYWNVVLDSIALLCTLGLSVVIWRKLGFSYALYVVLGVLIPASSGIMSMSRYVLILYPLFMLLAHWGENERLDRTYLTLGYALLGILTVASANWVFVA